MEHGIPDVSNKVDAIVQKYFQLTTNICL